MLYASIYSTKNTAPMNRWNLCWWGTNRRWWTNRCWCCHGILQSSIRRSSQRRTTKLLRKWTSIIRHWRSSGTVLGPVNLTGWHSIDLGLPWTSMAGYNSEPISRYCLYFWFSYTGDWLETRSSKHWHTTVSRWHHRTISISCAQMTTNPLTIILKHLAKLVTKSSIIHFREYIQSVYVCTQSNHTLIFCINLLPHNVHTAQLFWFYHMLHSLDSSAEYITWSCRARLTYRGVLSTSQSRYVSIYGVWRGVPYPLPSVGIWGYAARIFIKDWR